MKLRRLQERELVQAIRDEFSQSAKNLVLGIGDDAAIIRPGRASWLVTTDLLSEGFHFSVFWNPPFYLGRKSLNINLSDIAAMGGTPRFALLGLAVPSGLKTGWLEEFFSGFKQAAQEADVCLVGGDVSQSRKIVISVTVIGEGSEFVTRSGAKPGDRIYVSGCLGNARGGLALLQKGARLGEDSHADALLKAFLDPVPRIGLGRELARHKIASAMIDLSDGLSVDLFHLCEESGTGAEVGEEFIPLSPELRARARKPLAMALHGGEDYELLFTVPPARASRLARISKKYRLACIGRMTRGKGIYLVDRAGQKKRLAIKGFEHFR
jgi:thiamine-monophosphate kinase